MINPTGTEAKTTEEGDSVDVERTTRKGLVQAELGERINWLIRLRWLAVSGAVLTVWVASKPLSVITQPFPLYVIAISIAFYNTIFLLYAKRMHPLREGTGSIKAANTFANIQISVDLAALTLLIHFSGGVENPFMFYFIFHMIIASILLSSKATYLQATLATLLVAGVVILEYVRVIPHIDLVKFGPINLYSQGRYVPGVLVAFSSTLYLSVYMATSITKRLRGREDELVMVKESLEEANRKLQEMDRLKSEYVIKVTHELRSPLSTIESCLKVISEGYVSKIDEKQKEMVERAESRTEALLALVNDLLNLSRLRAAGTTQPGELMNLCPIIQCISDFLRTKAEAKGITLEQSFPCGLPTAKTGCQSASCEKAEIESNRDNMEHLFSNLLSNAIKYTTVGGKVTIKVTTKGNSYEIQVSDTGIGIPQGDLSRIFDEFYRGDNAKACDKEGTGLGLSIVKQIVHKEGGQIWVESEEGRGSRFNLLLPRQTYGNRKES